MRTILVFFFAFLLGDNVIAQITLFKTYKPGSYYDSSGKKITGLMDFEPSSDRIHFKKDKNSSSEKIPIKDISAVLFSFEDVNGTPVTDSLIVMTEDNKENKKYFAKLYFATPVTKFYYKFIESSSGGGGPTTLSNVPNSGNNGVHNVTIPSQSPLTSHGATLIMYQDGNTTYQLTKGNYIEVLSKACADQPDLVKRIQNKEFKFHKIYEIIAAYRK